MLHVLEHNDINYILKYYHLCNCKLIINVLGLIKIKKQCCYLSNVLSKELFPLPAVKGLLSEYRILGL